jgi:hypothetical protein
VRHGRALFLAVLLGVVAVGDAQAEVVDRVAVRFVAPETGGSAHPRFFTQREVAFHARLEALLEQSPIEGTEIPEAYARAAIDRLVARTMLASLMIQRGVEPPDLARASHEARGELEARLGEATLASTLKTEGIDDTELLAFLRDYVRATHYIDRSVTPVLTVTEDQLREAFRATLHPFRGAKFEDVRPRLKRWLVAERVRVAEIEYLQGVRARIRVTTIRP